MTQLRNIFAGLIFLVFLVFTGTFLMNFFEGYGFFDSFYYIVHIITTVGDSGIGYPGKAGQMITVVVLMLGMGTVIYLATSIASSLIEGHTRQIFSGLRGGLMRIKKEKNHIIVCGYGKLGKYVVDTLKQKKQKYLIIESNMEIAQNLLGKKEPVMQGDCLDPHVLERANISKAKAIIGALRNDADNIYLIMTALEANSNILCAAKASDEEAVKRLHKVGAQVVVFPQVVGGRQLANAVLEIHKSENLSSISQSARK